ncbi:MAG: alpha/beta hydrolase [Acidimicrobiia bacterium]|nr:alpha/beta hydrolase [Acidimicrobiia bacterium]
MTEFDLHTADGLALEARWDTPPTEPTRGIVFCHPHPLHGGTMTAPLMEKVTDHFVGAGAAVLRFNFRGIGRSQGGWGGGIGELDDVAAAVAAAQRAAADVSVIGWSFGAGAALRWQARDGDASTYVGIAPPIEDSSGNTLPAPGELRTARRTIIIGERDQLISVDDSRDYAGSIGAGFEVLPASDHFFNYREEGLAAMVLAAFD